MDFNVLAYLHLITIAENEYKAHRNENKVLIPYTEEPNVGARNLIYQRVGKDKLLLKLLIHLFYHGYFNSWNQLSQYTYSQGIKYDRKCS